MNLLIPCVLFCLINASPMDAEIVFTYKSVGTLSFRTTVIQFGADKKVRSVMTRNNTKEIIEEWTGRIDNGDFNAFIDEVMNAGNFFNLPAEIPPKARDRIRVKDSSWDAFILKIGGREHSIGGYAAMHYDEYKPVYQAMNRVLAKIKNIQYKKSVQ